MPRRNWWSPELVRGQRRPGGRFRRAAGQRRAQAAGRSYPVALGGLHGLLAGRGARAHAVRILARGRVAPRLPLQGVAVPREGEGRGPDSPKLPSLPGRPFKDVAIVGERVGRKSCGCLWVPPSFQIFQQSLFSRRNKCGRGDSLMTTKRNATQMSKGRECGG